MEVLGIDPIQRLVVPAGAGLDAGRRPPQRPGVGRRRRRRLLLQRRPAGRHAGRLPRVASPPSPSCPTCTSASSRRWSSAPSPAIVASYKGLNAGGGPKGVGDAVNQSVVITFMLLFVVNFVMTAVYFQVVPQKLG